MKTANNQKKVQLRQDNSYIKSECFFSSLQEERKGLFDMSFDCQKNMVATKSFLSENIYMLAVNEVSTTSIRL